MIERITNLDDVLDLFEGFETSMYRLEALQVYDVAYERDRYEAFLAGEPVDLAPSSWQNLVRRHRAEGRDVDRVHVVFEPLTEYLRYEMSTAYQRNAAAGERIAIIATAEGSWPAHVPTVDYWLFDDRDLWIMIYDAQGQFVAAERRTEPTEVQRSVSGKYAALRAAVPLADYLAAQPPLLRRVS